MDKKGGQRNQVNFCGTMKTPLAGTIPVRVRTTFRVKVDVDLG